MGKPPGALPLKCQDLSRTQWIKVGVVMLLFIMSMGAFVVVGYCTENACKIGFGSAGGSMLLCALCLAAHLVRYATFKPGG